jgi:hypothetical protein
MKKRKATKKKTPRIDVVRFQTGTFTARKKTIPSPTTGRHVPWVPSAREKVTKGGVILPASADDSLVPASKLRQGLKHAKLEIQNVLGDLASMLTEEYRIAEIELSASFSADGKFLGFGIGGDASIKVKIRPAS